MTRLRSRRTLRKKSLRSEKTITRILNKYHIGSKRSTPVIHESINL